MELSAFDCHGGMFYFRMPRIYGQLNELKN